MTDEALLERPIAGTQDTTGDAETATPDTSGETAPLFCSPVLDRIRTSD